jgi:excisionase family DNA binding protein
MAIGSKPVQNFGFQNAGSRRFRGGWWRVRAPGLGPPKRITFDEDSRAALFNLLFPWLRIVGTDRCFAGGPRPPIFTELSRCAKKRSMQSRLYTTREVAKRAGISRQTLQTWIAEKKVKAPAVLRAAGVRLWTESDLAEVLRVEPRSYPRGPKRNRRR